MSPTMTANENTLLIRKIPIANTRYVSHFHLSLTLCSCSFSNLWCSSARFCHTTIIVFHLVTYKCRHTVTCTNCLIWHRLDEMDLLWIDWHRQVFMQFVSEHYVWFMKPIWIPCLRFVFIGDAVVLKDPNDSDKYLVRRLAAVQGFEMVSGDEKEEPFVLEKDQCWVIAENQELKAKVHTSVVNDLKQKLNCSLSVHFILESVVTGCIW